MDGGKHFSARGPIPHESARKHVTGAAKFIDDELAKAGMVEVFPVSAPCARAAIAARDASAASRMEGVVSVLMAEDVPGLNNIGPIFKDEPLFATDEIWFDGQIIGAVVGESRETCRKAAGAVEVSYQQLPAVLDIGEARMNGAFLTEPHTIVRGEPASAILQCRHRVSGTVRTGAQEHFYLETQVSWAEPGEDGSVYVRTSTQHPADIQALVAAVLGITKSKVVVTCPRMGGAFGGKESQSHTCAVLAALAAVKTGRPARCRFDREQDMALTGKRHPFFAEFEVGFDDEGRILVADVGLFSDGGWSLDLSGTVMDRALLHLDNAYHIPHVRFSGRVCKTNKVSNTAFRGFGVPQGMLVMEEMIDIVVRHTGIAPEKVRQLNFYRDEDERNRTPYGQVVEHNRLDEIWDGLMDLSDFEFRRAELAAWNESNPHVKRGIAVTPVKFGVAFTVGFLNQAGALVHILTDGSVQVHHGGTEMGQGLHTKIAQVAASKLGIPVGKIRVMHSSTDKIPNSTPTAASCGTDLNGEAVADACRHLVEAMRRPAEKLLRAQAGSGELDGDITFADGMAFFSGTPEVKVSFEEVVQASWLSRVSLSATGFFRTPGIHYDRNAGQGKPFHYFCFGAAVSEVEIDVYTGQWRLLRVDIHHDTGHSLNELIDLGQVEGGFVQGVGWLTMEECQWGRDGKLQTRSADTYKIPSAGDAPPVFRVSFLTDAPNPLAIAGSKAVGEPPLMLALSVREALRDAIASIPSDQTQIPLACPSTNEAIFNAIRGRGK